MRIAPLNTTVEYTLGTDPCQPKCTVTDARGIRNPIRAAAMGKQAELRQVTGGNPPSWFWWAVGGLALLGFKSGKGK